MPGPYQLYLIRHAIAENRGPAWPDDTKRPLTSNGMARMKKATRGLRRLGVTLEIVLTSPFVRARQTAEIVAAACEPHAQIVNTEALVPGAGYATLVAELGRHSRKTRIAVVGHEPGIGELAARLIGSRHPFDFKKGAVCRIDLEEIPPRGPGHLRWLLTPKMLRAIRQ